MTFCHLIWDHGNICQLLVPRYSSIEANDEMQSELNSTYHLVVVAFFFLLLSSLFLSLVLFTKAHYKSSSSLKISYSIFHVLHRLTSMLNVCTLLVVTTLSTAMVTIATTVATALATTVVVVVVVVHMPHLLTAVVAMTPLRSTKYWDPNSFEVCRWPTSTVKM